MMLIGWCGNNGSTVTAGVVANKHGLTWETRRGEQRPNYWGSITQVRCGAVWCGVVRCGAVWCRVVQGGAGWCGECRWVCRVSVLECAFVWCV